MEAVRTGPVELGKASVPGSQSFLLEARVIDQTYEINVLEAVPPFRPLGPDDKLPVVFVLDAGFGFATVASSAMYLSFGDIPSVLVVGVGHPLDPSLSFLDALGAQQPATFRDFTPTFNQAFLDEVAGGFEQSGESYPDNGRPGGGDAFLAFINDEVKPFIAARYPEADLSDTTLVGHSLAGLLVMHALLSDPDAFQRYVASSPSLWWDDGVLLSDADAVGDVPARLFISFGGLEPAGQMLEPGARMDALLREAGPGLDYAYEVFSGENHGSVIPIAFSRGLRAVFDSPVPRPSSTPTDADLTQDAVR